MSTSRWLRNTFQYFLLRKQSEELWVKRRQIDTGTQTRNVQRARDDFNEDVDSPVVKLTEIEVVLIELVEQDSVRSVVRWVSSFIIKRAPVTELHCVDCSPEWLSSRYIYFRKTLYGTRPCMYRNINTAYLEITDEITWIENLLVCKILSRTRIRIKTIGFVR